MKKKSQRGFDTKIKRIGHLIAVGTYDYLGILFPVPRQGTQQPFLLFFPLPLQALQIAGSVQRCCAQGADAGFGCPCGACGGCGAWYCGGAC